LYCLPPRVNPTLLQHYCMTIEYHCAIMIFNISLYALHTVPPFAFHATPYAMLVMAISISCKGKGQHWLAAYSSRYEYEYESCMSGSEIRCFVSAPSANIRIVLKKKKLGQILVLAKKPKNIFFSEGPGPGIFSYLISKQIFFTVKLHRTSHPHTHVADDMERFNNN